MIGVLSFSSAAVKSECVFFTESSLYLTYLILEAGAQEHSVSVVFTRKKTPDYQVYLKRTACSLWYKNVQPFCVRMGPKILPAPSSFLCVDVVARGCQQQMAQLSGAMKNLQGYKPCI